MRERILPADDRSDEHEGNYLDVCRHYRAMAATPIVAEDKAELHRVRAAGLSEGENSTS